MREMKDSGIEWIGKIPADWIIKKVKNATSYIGSGTTPTSGKSEFYDDGTVNWIQSGDLYGKDEINDASANVTNYAVKLFSALHIYKAPFIVIAMYGGSVGNIAISNIDACVNQACCCIQEDNQNDLKFMYYWLFSCKSDFLRVTDGGGQPNISQTKIKNQYYLQPSLPEQHSISSYLDTKCSEIDALTADIQSQIGTLEQYKRSVITEAVTKGLNPNVKMKDSGIEWAERIPAHWETMHNKYLMKKEKEICPVYEGEDILSLTMQGVIVRDLSLGGKMPTTFNGYQRIHPGNLLMCLFDYDVTPRCIGLIKNEGLTSPAYSQFVMNDNADAHYYYYYYLMLDFTKELLHLAKNLRHSFTEDQLGEINTVVPPLYEQRQIAAYLDKKVEQIDETIELKNKQISLLDSYKKSMIYEYVTGKKEVPAHE